MWEDSGVSLDVVVHKLVSDKPVDVNKLVALCVFLANAIKCINIFVIVRPL